MKLFCSHCAKPFPLPAGSTGDSVKCPECGQEVPVPSSPVSPGVVISDFLIEKPISKGGMGEVYLARQLSLDRPVALKVLQSKFTDDNEYIDSLFREARAAAKINHPNIVQAYAVGEEEGIFFFAMEFVRGNTFKTILKENGGKLDFKQAAKVICEVAGALAAAWKEQKLVHQDIKPDNIMLDANGFAKLADMGLAKTAGMPQNDEDADEVLGTPQYISPEQLTGVPTDVRSDIYSLGATFYQFVTGRFAYVGANAEDITKQHVEGKLLPPKEVNPELPDELNAVILKMMARLPENRYQTPEPLVHDLEQFLLHAKNAPQRKPKINLNLPGKAGAAKPLAPAVKPAPVLKPIAPAVKPTPVLKPIAPAEPPPPPPKEETPEEIAARKRRSRTILRWILIGAVSLLLFLIAGFLITLLTLEERSATPEFLKPVSRPIHQAISQWGGSVKKKAIELSKPTIVTVDHSAPKEVTTRQEYLDNVALILDGYAADRANHTAFLRQVDQHWRKILDARTPEEKEAERKLVETFSAADEVNRAAQAREELRRRHLLAIAQKQEKRKLEEQRKQEMIAAAERKQEEERRQAMEMEEKRKNEQEYRRRQTAELKEKLDSFYPRLAALAVATIKEKNPPQWQPLFQEISNDLAAAPRNDDEQRTMIRQFETFCKELPLCVKDAREKTGELAKIRENAGINIATGKGMATLVSIGWGRILCRGKNDALFELNIAEDARARKNLLSALTRRKCQNPNFYLALMCAPEIITDAELPPGWKNCWPIIKNALK